MRQFTNKADLIWFDLDKEQVLYRCCSSGPQVEYRCCKSVGTVVVVVVEVYLQVFQDTLGNRLLDLLEIPSVLENPAE